MSQDPSILANVDEMISNAINSSIFVAICTASGSQNVTFQPKDAAGSIGPIPSMTGAFTGRGLILRTGTGFVCLGPTGGGAGSVAFAQNLGPFTAPPIGDAGVSVVPGTNTPGNWTPIARKTFAAHSINTNAVQSSSNATVTLPSGIANGDIVLVFSGQTGSFHITSMTAPGGRSFTQLGLATGASAHLSVWWRRCDGGEGTSATIVVTGGAAYGHVAVRLPAADVSAFDDPQISVATSNAGSAAPDPGAVSQPGRFFAFACWSAASAPAPTAEPAGYTTAANISSNANGCSVVEKSSAGETSEDPGAFTIAGAVAWNAFTVAVPMNAAGGVDEYCIGALLVPGASQTYLDLAFRLVPVVSFLVSGVYPMAAAAAIGQAIALWQKIPAANELQVALASNNTNVVKVKLNFVATANVGKG